MAARTKQEPAAVAEYQAPSPAGCAAHERSDWLPDLSLPWLRDLRARHVELAQAWATAVDAIGGARDRAAELEGAYRQSVRNAVAVGDPAPARSPELDPAIREAQVAIALEDAQAVRDDLAEHVLQCLAVLRAHRSELAPHFASFNADLLAALARGAANQRSIIAEKMRRTLAELDADGPAIEVFDDNSPADTPEGAHA